MQIENKKLVLGEKYFDIEQKCFYELTGIVERNYKKVALLRRGVATQEVNLDDFWKVFIKI